ADLPFTRGGVVVDKFVAQPAPREGTFAEQLRGSGQRAGQRRAPASRVGVDGGRRQLELALNAIEAGSKRGRHREIRIDIGARQTHFHAGRFTASRNGAYSRRSVVNS